MSFFMFEQNYINQQNIRPTDYPENIPFQVYSINIFILPVNYKQ